MSGVMKSGAGGVLPMLLAGKPTQQLADSVETQQRQAALLRAQQEEDARFAADEPGRKAALAQFGPSYSYDQRRARTSLLGVG